jgi:hypothetical protein
MSDQQVQVKKCGYIHNQKRAKRIFDVLCRNIHAKVVEENEDGETSHSIKIEERINAFGCLGMEVSAHPNPDESEDHEHDYRVEECDLHVYGSIYIKVDDYILTDYDFQFCSEVGISDEVFVKFWDKFQSAFCIMEQIEFSIANCEHCDKAICSTKTCCDGCDMRLLNLNTTCAICLEGGESIWKSLNNCQHIFHAKCLRKIRRETVGCIKCPLCREDNILHMAKEL